MHRPRPRQVRSPGRFLPSEGHPHRWPLQWLRGHRLLCSPSLPSSDRLVNLGCAHRGVSPHSRVSCPPCPVTVCLTYRRMVAGASSHLGLPVGGKGALEGPHIIVLNPSLVPPTGTHPDPEQLPHCQPPGGRSQPLDTCSFMPIECRAEGLSPRCTVYVCRGGGQRNGQNPETRSLLLCI